MNNDFLPEEYKVPEGNYMKLQKGENRIRIFSKPIIGWLDWDDKKPLRYRMNAKPDYSIDAEKPIRHFWAMVVYNYAAKKLQVLEITQKTIQETIQSLAADEDWGHPSEYDIKITRKGDGMQTEYVVTPCPKKPAPVEISETFTKANINLDALYEGGDPFANTPF
jgi:hypothetical protein